MQRQQQGTASVVCRKVKEGRRGFDGASGAAAAAGAAAGVDGWVRWLRCQQTAKHVTCHAESRIFNAQLCDSIKRAPIAYKQIITDRRFAQTLCRSRCKQTEREKQAHTHTQKTVETHKRNMCVVITSNAGRAQRQRK